MYFRGQPTWIERWGPWLLVAVGFLPVVAAARRYRHAQPQRTAWVSTADHKGGNGEGHGGSNEALPILTAVQLRVGHGLETLGGGKVRFLSGGGGCFAPSTRYGYFDGDRKALNALMLSYKSVFAFVSFHRFRTDLLHGQVRRVEYDVRNGRLRYQRHNPGAAIGIYDVAYASLIDLSWALTGHRLTVHWRELAPPPRYGLW